MGKTAVVIIHGIGEQRPMATVRGFVRFFAGEMFRSKPDAKADLYEIRRLSTYGSGPHDEAALAEARKALASYPPDTVFFEYYWAFHFRDTKVSAVLRWAASTLRDVLRTRTLSSLRGPVRRIAATWAVILFLAAAGVVLLAWGLADLLHSHEQQWLGMVKVLAGSILPLLLWLTQPILVGTLGDAARYFSATPESPVERQAIRAQGVSLLRRLHAEKQGDRHEYSRIVVVGHSLGSVIAYDLLTHYWAEVGTGVKIRRTSTVLMDIEAHAKSATASQRRNATEAHKWAQKYHAAQADLAGEVYRSPWRISDFVTIGSPLTYAHFLMANGEEDLNARKDQRELPACPPVVDQHPDKHGQRRSVYHYEPVTGPDHVVPHHAAPFLVTQWTNLYLPHDPIGGPLQNRFGPGVLDVELDYRSSHGTSGVFTPILDMLGGAHVRYWETANGRPTETYSPKCAEVLRAIVNAERPWAVGATGEHIGAEAAGEQHRPSA